jgi:hypothetical protein
MNALAWNLEYVGLISAGVLTLNLVVFSVWTAVAVLRRRRPVA